MFESEIRIEVERRLQKTCDDRARDGLPSPVSIDALRAIVRSDLLREIGAARVACGTVGAKPVAAAKSTPKTAAPSIAKRQPAPEQSATGRLMELVEELDLREPVFPSLRGVDRTPTPPVDGDEVAARAILEAGRIARGR